MDGWSKKKCPVQTTACGAGQSEATAKHTAHAAPQEATTKALAQDKLEKANILSDTIYPLELRVLGKISLLDIDQDLVNLKQSKQHIKLALSKYLDVSTQAIALPTTIPIVPLLELLTVQQTRTRNQQKGFVGSLFGSVFSQNKNKKNKVVVPKVGEVKFKVGCTTEEQQQRVLKKVRALSVGKPFTANLQQLIVAQGFAAGASKLMVTNVMKGEPVDVSIEPVQKMEIEQKVPSLLKSHSSRGGGVFLR